MTKHLTTKHSRPEYLHGIELIVTGEDFHLLKLSKSEEYLEYLPFVLDTFIWMFQCLIPILEFF